MGGVVGGTHGGSVGLGFKGLKGFNRLHFEFSELTGL